jgi:hypothetical protein
MSEIKSSRVAAFLANAASRPKPRGSLIFGLDATASRERTWDTAAQLQVRMFQEVAAIGALDVQLIYFRGMKGVNAECKASPWVNDPLVLTKMMTKIRCETGYTQIERILDHVLREAKARTINAMVYVGDACEEERGVLVRLARELGDLKVPAFMFQEGRDFEAEARFQEIAELTHGAYHRFDLGSGKLLADLLKAVAAFAVGGVAALEKHGSDAAKLLLGQVR